jgi:2-amino-4-hydroxy-6-hydroxymethyldihydropteridine diphosphokinase
MTTAYLGFGSNLGDRMGYINRAIRDMNERGIRLRKMSTVVETDPVGGPPQGKYLNAVAECETDLTPAELLATLKDIERDLGRVKTVPDGPRVIDLDILLYDHLKIKQDHLEIPHPKMLSREFVMGPLREIAPDIAEELKQCAS